MMERTDNNEKISDEIVDLVVARLETIPSNIEISIGNEGSFSIGELIDRVRSKDEVGKKMIEMQLQYIRSLKDSAKNDSHYKAIVR